MFVTLWEFEVKPGCEESFENAYGPDGPWVQLFRRDSRYRKTLLLKDPFRPRIYLTLDFWDEKTACLRFQVAHHAAYAEIDLATGALTLQEHRIGSFEQSEIDSGAL